MNDLELGCALLGVSANRLAYAHFRADGSFVTRILDGDKRIFSAREVETILASGGKINLADGVSDAEATLAGRALHARSNDDVVETRSEMRSTVRDKSRTKRG